MKTSSVDLGHPSAKALDDIIRWLSQQSAAYDRISRADPPATMALVKFTGCHTPVPLHGNRSVSIEERN